MKKESSTKPAPGSFDEGEGVSDRRHAHRRAICLRLKRVEGQVRGVLRMIENDFPCDEIAQQLAAARHALDRAFFEMMACSIESEIIESSTDMDTKHARVTEIMKVLSKYA